MGEAKRRSRARAEFEAQPVEVRLGDGPVQEEYHDKMTAVVQALDELFNGQIGGPGRKTGLSEAEDWARTNHSLGSRQIGLG